MDVPAVELVTLSDSLTSPIPKLKLKSRNADQGTTKVVCLDSDTESDGSFVHTMVSRVALKAANTEIFGVSSDECNKKIDNWPGLHKCSTNSRSWNASHILSPEKEVEMDIHEACNADEQPDQTFNFSPDSISKKIHHSCDTTMFSASPRDEVRGLSQGLEWAKNHSVCLSSPSKDLADCSSPAWDDHLKGIISKLETSKAVPQDDASSKRIVEQERNREFSDYESDDKNFGNYSFLKQKLRKCDAGDAAVSGDRNSCKRLKKCTKGVSSAAEQQGSKTTANTIVNSISAPDKEIEMLYRKEKQTKDREEREARKQQLKVEREILRQEKQEEKKRRHELKRRRNEEEKKRKEELKAENVERRKVEKEKEKWEKGKFALQNITALVDTQILEGGLIGGLLLTRFAEKGFKYHLVKNPVKKTVIWQMKLPSKESLVDSQEDYLSQDSQEPKTSKILGPQVMYRLTCI